MEFGIGLHVRISVHMPVMIFPDCTFINHVCVVQHLYYDCRIHSLSKYVLENVSMCLFSHHFTFSQSDASYWERMVGLLPCS